MMISRRGYVITDRSGRFIGPVVLGDEATARQRCEEVNLALRNKHPEWKGDAFKLEMCVVEVSES